MTPRRMVYWEQQLEEHTASIFKAVQEE